MTDSYLATGEMANANMAQDFVWRVKAHQFGRGSIEFVPSMVRLARFKTSIRQFDDARKNYSEAIVVTENALGENDLALVELLVGLASVRQDQRALRQARPPSSG